MVLDREVMLKMHGVFLENHHCASHTDEALGLTTKKKNLRILDYHLTQDASEVEAEYTALSRSPRSKPRRGERKTADWASGYQTPTN